MKWEKSNKENKPLWLEGVSRNCLNIGINKIKNKKNTILCEKESSARMEIGPVGLILNFKVAWRKDNLGVEKGQDNFLNFR